MTVAQLRRSLIIALSIIGLLLVLASLLAQPLGLQPNPRIRRPADDGLSGSVTCLTFAAYLYLYSIRPPDAPKSLQADVGIRLSATGLVLALAAGYADLLGFGTHIGPSFERPLSARCK
ncbi:MAG: hypothetical protein R3C44_00605 [Chloroflexota bacterium]